jgi:predicted secreted protein
MNPRTSAIPEAVALLLLVITASLAGCARSPAEMAPTDAAASQVNGGTGGSGAGTAGVSSTSPKPADAAFRFEEFRLTVSCDEFLGAQSPEAATAALQQTILPSADGEVTVTLCSNASTGFAWDEPRYDPSVLALVSHTSPPPATSLPGAPGSDTWVFRALGCPIIAPLACGSSDVVFTYSQPWAGGAKAAWTFTVTVDTVQVPVIEQEPPQPSEPGLR